MATSTATPAPATSSSTTPERQRSRRSDCSLEDRLDAHIVERARVLARRRGERAVSWAEFKKTLNR